MDINDVFVRICDIVDQHGWAVQAVFADAEHGIPEFSYTVGLAKRGLPEVMIFAVDPRTAHAILNDAAQKLVDGLIKPEQGLLIPELANVPLRVNRLSESQFDAFANMAMRYGEKSGFQVTSIQLQFPDRAGLFPGDEGCDENMIRIQDIDSLAHLQATAQAKTQRGRAPRTH